jgi:hypothetical protein
MRANKLALVLAASAFAGACGKADDADDTSRVASSGQPPSATASSGAPGAKGSSAPTTAPATATAPMLGRIQQLALGGRMDCGRKDDGSVWCWDATSAAKHVAMEATKQIAVVDSFVCAISPKGHIACTETQTGATTPISLYRDGVVITGGPAGYCVRTEDGVLRCGVEDADPHVVKAPSGLPGLKDPSAFALGATLGCAVLDGEIWCWNTEKGAGLPRRLKELKGAASVAVGRLRGCASTTSGEIFCYRADRDAVPRKLDGWQDIAQLAMAYGAAEPDRLCALKRDATVVCGLLRGDGDAAEFEAPKPIEAVANAVELGTGAANHSCARTKTGNVWCWGLEQTRATAVLEATAR